MSTRSLIYSGPSVPVRLRFVALYAAWRLARRGKRPSANHLAFASRWLDALQILHQQLRAGTWLPRRTVSFVVSHPKTREIHAPDFADRVVHHWLVPQLEALYEPIFIHDSFANRAGKGSHAAVNRLQAFMRQRNGRGYYLQLDIHNFFNSIHRATLYGFLKHRIAKNTATPIANLPHPHARPTTAKGLNRSHGLALQSLCHKLLAQPAPELCVNPAAAAMVPPHKRLRNAPVGYGLPIGNLTSQFFANVYLNALDQFVKHTLKVRHYVRYVDDFVLLADTPEQLCQWHQQITQFLHTRLRLRLKDGHRLASLQHGVDFLGYVIYPQHRLVRRRVVAHCKTKLQNWAQRHCRVTKRGYKISASAPNLAQLQAMLASYWGHFSHAHSVRLRHALFHINLAGAIAPRWVLQGVTLTEQIQCLRDEWPHAVCEVQKGFETLCFAPLKTADGSRVQAEQTGWLRHGVRRREITRFLMIHDASP